MYLELPNGPPLSKTLISTLISAQSARSVVPARITRSLSILLHNAGGSGGVQRHRVPARKDDGKGDGHQHRERGKDGQVRSAVRSRPVFGPGSFAAARF